MEIMPKIESLPLDSRPREKAIASGGCENLSSVELLALLIGSGVSGASALEIAASLLGEYSSLTRLSRAKWDALARKKGLGDVKAIVLAAAFELAKRIEREKEEEITSDVLRPSFLWRKYHSQLAKEHRESLLLILVNRNREIIKTKTMYVGTEKAMAFDPRDIVVEALLNYAYGIVIIHNHPSGVCWPSGDDVDSTNLLQKECKSLRLHLLDHIIVSENEYYSFKENKML